MSDATSRTGPFYQTNGPNSPAHVSGDVNYDQRGHSPNETVSPVKGESTPGQFSGNDQLKTESASNNRPHVGVIMAKDHERNWIKGKLQSLGFEIGKPRMVDGLSLLDFQINNNPIVLGFANDMGAETIAEYSKKFVQVVNPRWITSLGICGGSKENMEKAIFFSGSYFNNKRIGFEIPPNLLPVEVWRAMYEEDKEDWIVPPHKPRCFVFTSTERGTSNEEATSNILKDHPDCLGIDMEIGSIYTTIRSLNRDRPAPIQFLHPIKAVSDSGNDTERDEHGKPATENCLRAFIRYIKYLDGIGLFHANTQLQ